MLNRIRIYGEVRNELEFRDIFRRIRNEVKRTNVPETLTNLYQFAGFLTALTDAPCWRMLFNGMNPDYGALSRDEFQETAIEINTRAEQIGCELRFSELWTRMLPHNHREMAQIQNAIW